MAQWQPGKGVGPNGKFSTTDHRWFWASFDKINMDKVWLYYYSTKEDYERCCSVKKRVDPNGVFTPNMFAVGYPDSAPKRFTSSVAPDSEATITGQPDEILDDAAFTERHADRAKRRAQAKGILWPSGETQS